MLTTLILLLILPLQANIHKYYISITEITYDTKSSKLNVSTKVFFDDLQAAILVDQNVRIDDPVNDYSKEIEEYILTHFGIKANDEVIELSIQSIEPKLDAIWIELESKPVPFSKQWEVTNSIFVDIYPSQNNIVNFYPDKANTQLVKGLSLNDRKRTGQVSF